MRASEYRHYVEVQDWTVTIDAMGQEIRSPSIIAYAWVAIDPTGGKEAMIGAIEQASASVAIRMRYMTGITSGMRIVHGTRAFNIGAVINVDERNEELRLTCTEVV